MPLNAPPVRGYPDGARVIDYDSGLLWNVTTGAISTTTTSPVLDVSRFAYIGGYLAETLSHSNINPVWYSDAAATILVADRNIQLSNQIVQQAQLRIPNLGPFLKVTANRPEGGNYNLTARLFGTNRVHPLEFIPVTPIVIDQQAVALPGGNSTFYPTDYYAGPLRTWSLLGATVTNNLSLQGLNINGGWDFLDQVTAVVAPGLIEIMVTPPGAWRIQASNSGAATTLYLNAVPSTTGAA